MLAVVPVEGAGRFVGENQARILDQRSAYRHPLFLFGFGVPGVDYDAEVEPAVMVNRMTDLAQ